MTTEATTTPDPYKLTPDSFFKQYKPITNPNSKSSGPEKVQFYPGNEADMEMVKKYAQSNQVWTWVSGNDEIIITGYWLADALAYFITDKPWDNIDLWLEYCI